jgi:hypothetical protein
MSSMIEDLPGPQDNLKLHDSQQIEMQQMEMQEMERQQMEMQEMERQQIERQQMQRHRVENFEEPKSQIKLQIKKKNISESSIFDTIKYEFNLNNLIILIALYLACIPESNEIIRKLLNGNSYSHFSVTIIKCIVLLLIIVLIKHFYVQ